MILDWNFSRGHENGHFHALGMILRFSCPIFMPLGHLCKAKKKRKTGKHVKKANLTFCMGKRMYLDFTSVFLCGENATHHILPLWLRAQKSELRMLYGESHVFVFLLGCK